MSRPAWIAASLAGANLVVCAVGLSGLVGATPLNLGSAVSSILPTPTTTSRPAGHATSPTTPPLTSSGQGGTTETVGATRPVSRGAGITAIGDSIMIDAAPYLRQLLPGITIDAIEGQQLYELADEAPKLRAEDAVGNRLILELGTNGPFSLPNSSASSDPLARSDESCS